MQTLIETLKTKRQALATAQELVDKSQAALEATDEYRDLLLAKTNLDMVQDELKDADEALRECALLEYATSGNKKPYEGVTVVINKRLEYDAERAIRWAAANNALGMLKLQKREFEKHARNVLSTLPLEFVDVIEETGVRVAKEL